jgi:tRNA(adenine34) deaminase
MCAGAAVLARLDRVVYGARDPKAGAAGSLWDLVRDRRLNHRPEVIPGVLDAPAATLLTRFFRPTDYRPRPPMG